MVMKDPEDVIIYRKSIERLRVHIFLAGLDEEFDQVCGEILRKDTIPNLKECYSIIRKKDVRQSKLNKKVDDSETSAMIALENNVLKLLDILTGGILKGITQSRDKKLQWLNPHPLQILEKNLQRKLQPLSIQVMSLKLLHMLLIVYE